MNEDERRELVEDYLARLGRELDGAPLRRRRELVDSIREHIEEAWDASPERNRASLVGILERLGEPEEVAREALEEGTTTEARDATQAVAALNHAVTRGWRALGVRLTAILLLLIGIAPLVSDSDEYARLGVLLGGLSAVVAVWGYRHRRSLGWGWVIVPLVLAAVWWTAAFTHLAEEPRESEVNSAAYWSTVDAPAQPHVLRITDEHYRIPPFAECVPCGFPPSEKHSV